MSQPEDPRERLMAVGNQLLDCVYRVQKAKVGDLQKAVRAAKLSGDHSEASALLSNPARIIEALQLLADRDALLVEYCTIRETIEAMDAATPINWDIEPPSAPTTKGE